MAEPFDSHAWLRSFYLRLQRNQAFDRLSPAHQFEQLRTSIAAEHPEEAEQMRMWSPKAQIALMAYLAKDAPTPAAVTLLWRLRKEGREVRCVAQYLSTGIDLRLLEGDGFRKTQLCHSPTAANILAEQWRLACSNAAGERNEPRCLSGNS
jgi:hypothetical protein